jgi:hypothetical protein
MFVKFVCASIQISNIFVFIISFKLINFVFQVFPSLFPKCSTQNDSFRNNVSEYQTSWLVLSEEELIHFRLSFMNIDINFKQWF